MRYGYVIVNKLYKEEPKDFYVYSHHKANGDVFYVGKGKGNRAVLTHKRSSFWNKTSKKYGVYAKIVCDGLQEWAAFELESELISYYGRVNDGTGCLVNLTDGGEGASGAKMPEHLKEKLRQRNSNRTWSQSQREKYSATYAQRSDSLRIKSADKNIYNFVNKDGNCFTGKRIDFKATFGFDPVALFTNSNKSDTAKGWGVCKNNESIEDCLNRMLNSRIICRTDYTIYTFVHEDGALFSGTRGDFCDKYGLDKIQVNTLFKKTKPRKKVHGWSLLKD